MFRVPSCLEAPGKQIDWVTSMNISEQPETRLLKKRTSRDDEGNKRRREEKINK